MLLKITFPVSYLNSGADMSHPWSSSLTQSAVLERNTYSIMGEGLHKLVLLVLIRQQTLHQT